jgi:hypothetical protein
LSGLTVSSSFSSSSEQFKSLSRTLRASITQSAECLHTDLALIGTGALNLTTGSLSNAGWLWLKNHSSYGTVTLGPYISATFHEVLLLGPGDISMFNLEPGTTVRVVADQPDVLLEWSMFEE